jgi:hypothetical protein
MLTMQRSRTHGHSEFDPSNIPSGLDAVATCAVATTTPPKWRLVFDNPVQIKALPVDFTVNGAAPTAWTQESPTQITLTFATAVATGQTWRIPAKSPHIRTATGGYVAAATGTF